MKKQFKQSLIMTMLISSLGVIGYANAQQNASSLPILQKDATQAQIMAQNARLAAMAANPTAPVPGVVPAPMHAAQVMPSNVGTGNSFEHENTPLLREFSRKRTELELRKIDRELEKLDEEALKAKLDMDAQKNGGNSSGKPAVYNPFSNSSPAGNVPSSAPMMMPNMAIGTGGVSGVTSDIKVVMILGFDGQLSAKISVGTQGGYVVKKGDVLPNGEVVSAINANYIEIKTSQSDKTARRVYVSAGQTTVNSAPGMVSGGTGGSTTLPSQAAANNASIANLVAPIGAPQK